MSQYLVKCRRSEANSLCVYMPIITSCCMQLRNLSLHYASLNSLVLIFSVPLKSFRHRCALVFKFRLNACETCPLLASKKVR